MTETRMLMGMHVTVEAVDACEGDGEIDKIFRYFEYVDEKFSTYKNTSEISKINRDEITESEYSPDMESVLMLCDETNKLTDGYFDIVARNGTLDPSGLVKGWAIFNAAKILLEDGFKNFYVDAGGDIQVYGKNKDKKPWSIGIKNPFNQKEIVKVVYLKDEGIATSGTYIRGAHVYNPKDRDDELSEIVSVTIIGPNVYEADRFATAAFAMGREGIDFVESLPGFEGYMIDKDGQATMTSGFNKYTRNNA